jgi:hypothetical protein
VRSNLALEIRFRPLRVERVHQTSQQATHYSALRAVSGSSDAARLAGR